MSEAEGVVPGAICAVGNLQDVHMIASFEESCDLLAK
jgi:hypothetical protein